MSDITQRALEFARIKHSGQTRDDGLTAFIVHPLQVGNLLEQVTDDENLIAAGYLHDILEDTDVTYGELANEFNQDIADLVMEVTHDGDRTSGYYFPRLISQRGIMLKFADRLSNLSDMDGWDAPRQQHYLKRSKFWRSER